MSQLLAMVPGLNTGPGAAQLLKQLYPNGYNPVGSGGGNFFGGGPSGGPPASPGATAGGSSNPYYQPPTAKTY